MDMKLLVSLNYLISESKPIMTNDEFIEKARKVHGDKYDYSQVDYVGPNEKVTIICPKHGPFTQRPKSHLYDRRGCKTCGNNMKSTEDFIQDAKKVHGDKYDYSEVDYNGANKNVTIICPKHGPFPQTPSNHLKGYGCSSCGDNMKSTEDFIRDAKKVHGDKYDYSEVDYKGGNKKVTIICPKHGPFRPTAQSHLNGIKCRKCSSEELSVKKTKSLEDFIEDARKVHGDKYDYSNVDYKNSNTNINIICKKHDFEFPQTPANHLKGNGCPICAESKGEKYVANILNNRNITYVRQKRFKDCKGFCKTLSFDFYLPDYNILIEYDGRQHFEPINKWGGNDSLKKQQMYDTIKNEYAKRNNIKLIRIPYTLPLKDVYDLLTREIK